MNQTYRTPAKQAEVEPAAMKTELRKKSDWVSRIFLTIAAGMTAFYVVNLVKSVHGGLQCERAGRCDAGKPTWIESKCVFITSAHIKE